MPESVCVLAYWIWFDSHPPLLSHQVVSPVEDQPHPLSTQRKMSTSGKTQLSRLKEEQEGDSDASPREHLPWGTVGLPL